MRSSSRLSLASLALALLSTSLASPFTPTASADEPTLAERVAQRVEEGLVAPLARSERSTSRFSRARPSPHQRRVRALQTTATLDAGGRAYVPFAVDVRFGAEWSENDIVGCAYVGRGDLYVKVGDGYRSADYLLGKPSEPVHGACEAAPSS